MASASLLKQLVRRLGYLPGLGPRSGRRVALYLLKNRQRVLLPLIELLRQAAEKVHPCSVCGYMDQQDPCVLCQDTTRDNAVLCVVSHIPDVWAMERGKHFNGRYHILGGNLSVLEGVGPGDLRIASLIERLKAGTCSEVILALSSTVEGAATTHLVLQEIKRAGLQDVTITLLARGVPTGGELDFLDEATLKAALDGRQQLSPAASVSPDTSAA